MYPEAVEEGAKPTLAIESDTWSLGLYCMIHHAETSGLNPGNKLIQHPELVLVTAGMDTISSVS